MKRSWKFVVGAACVGLIVPGGLAQIVSPDLMWSATLDANNTGQIISMDGGGGDFIFETLWYEAVSFAGGVTRRVETNYTAGVPVIGANSASFTMSENGGNLRLEVDVTMINGAAGGALVDMTWTNTNAAGRTIVVKPFAYGDYDVVGALGDDAMWTGTAIEQTDAGQTYWFGGTQPYKSWEIDTFAVLRTALDGGANQLSSAGGGLNADWTGAVSGAEVALAPGQSMSFSLGIGGVGIPEPTTLLLLGLGGLAALGRRR